MTDQVCHGMVSTTPHVKGLTGKRTFNLAFFLDINNVTTPIITTAIPNTIANHVNS